MSTGFKLEGMDELVRNLAKLETRAGRKVLRKGTRAASSPIQKAVRKATPVGPGIPSGPDARPPGALKKSIWRKFKFYRGSTTDVAVIGPKWPGGSHGHLVELGTKERTNPNRFGKGPGSTGSVAGKPFVGPATKAVFAAAGKLGAEALKKAVLEEVRKL